MQCATKNIICSFSFPYIARNIRKDTEERESQRSRKCTDTVATVPFFCFVLPGSKSPMIYIIFQMLTQFFQSHLPPTCYKWTRLLSSIPPTQPYEAHPLRKYLCSVYFRKQVHILLCSHTNYTAGTRNLPVDIQHASFI